jgi:hypothetical protein
METGKTKSPISITFKKRCKDFLTSVLFGCLNCFVLFFFVNFWSMSVQFRVLAGWLSLNKTRFTTLHGLMT